MGDDAGVTALAAAGTGLPRRGFVMTSLIAGFTLATARVDAQAIHTDSAGLSAGATEIPVSDGRLPAYFARPAQGSSLPTILVIEEIFGVHEYIKDVCRRLAKAGYLAVAPELYARLGDLSKMTDAGEIFRDVINKAPDITMMSDLDATAAWAAAHGGNPAALGVVGFCWGGRDVWLYSARNTSLKAAVSFYGHVESPRTPLHPRNALDIAAEINCPLLGLYGAKDPANPPAEVQTVEDKARAAGKTVEIVMYPDAGHGFHADYRPSYVRADAEDAWRRTLAWFRSHGLGTA